MANTTAQDDADRAVMRAMAARMLGKSAAQSSAASSVTSTSPRTMPRTAYSPASSRASNEILQENVRPARSAQGFSTTTMDMHPSASKRARDETVEAAPKQTSTDEHKGPSLFGTADQLREARMFIHDATKSGNKSRPRSTRSEQRYPLRTASPMSTRSIDRYTTRPQSAPRSTSDTSSRAPHTSSFSFGTSTASSTSVSAGTSNQPGHGLAQASGLSGGASLDTRPVTAPQASQSFTSTPMEGVEPPEKSPSYTPSALQTKASIEQGRVATTAAAPTVGTGAAQPPHLSKVSKPVAVESKPLPVAAPQPKPETKPLPEAAPEPKPATNPSNDLKPGSVEWMKAIGAATKLSMDNTVTAQKTNGEVTKPKALDPTQDISKMLENLSVFKRDVPATATVKKTSEANQAANNDGLSQLESLTTRVAALERASVETNAAVLRLQESEMRRKYLGTDKGKEPFEITVHLVTHGIKVLIPTKMEDRVSSLIRAATTKVAIDLTGKDPRLSFKGNQIGHMMLVGEVGIAAGDTVDVTF